MVTMGTVSINVLHYLPHCSYLMIHPPPSAAGSSLILSESSMSLINPPASMLLNFAPDLTYLTEPPQQLFQFILPDHGRLISIPVPQAFTIRSN